MRENRGKWLSQSPQLYTTNSRLFQNEGIVLEENWLTDVNEQTALNRYSQLNDSSSCQGETTSDSEDQWTEPNEFRQPSGNMDTFMHPADFREFNRIVTIAPAENNTPLSVFQDTYAEILAFPKLYCGAVRAENKRSLHYSTICKWELRNKDRRVAKCVSNIFYKVKKLQIKQVCDRVSLAVRKCKLKDCKITADYILDKSNVDKILRHDEGYRILRTLRGSPPYWEQARKDIFAMIRQLGIPTWFCSFSAAETKWIPLLQTLGLLINGQNYSEEEIQALNWAEKCHLIKSDPVTCARYFDYRVQIFLHKVLLSEVGPIGEIVDYFYRVEFQQRGSPHVHMLVWIANAPNMATHCEQDITQFVDTYVTTKKNPLIKDLVNYQTHRHARTCRKKGQDIYVDLVFHCLPCHKL